MKLHGTNLVPKVSQGATMMEVGMKANKISRGEKFRLITECQQSGLAEKNGIVVASFIRKEVSIVEVKSLELYDQLFGVSSNA